MLRSSLERSLIEHCSPVLAGLKAANLLSYVCEDLREVEGFLQKEGRELAEKGVALAILRKKENRLLLYVYREELLKALLGRPAIREFLEGYGYKESSIAYSLRRLGERLGRKEEFPHEIGVFLDYPLGDVKGFIENQGRNCKCTGCWKVYCDECEAKRTFQKFEQCRQFYLMRFLAGCNVVQLAAGGL